MHNQLLGTAKRVLCIWKKFNIITSDKFLCIQALVDRFVTPSDIGRIPIRIESAYSRSVEALGACSFFGLHEELP